jgi:hypothetical protein
VEGFGRGEARHGQGRAKMARMGLGEDEWRDSHDKGAGAPGCDERRNVA